MTVKKFHFLLIALLCLAITSCQKEPSTSDLHKDYLVYTASDPATDFATFDSYYLPDSILLIGTSDTIKYWKDDDARAIIQTVADNMAGRNFTRLDQKQGASMGVQLSYVKQVTYFVGHDSPYWWWYYPHYWAPGYWGDWYGWHYGFATAYYAYTAGSLLIEIVNLEKQSLSETKLPILWDCFTGGLLTDSQEVNLARSIEAVNQAFVQSPSLKR
ncbi:MAG: DUF4136 domain-containing protein [Alistipes sp.]